MIQSCGFSKMAAVKYIYTFNNGKAGNATSQNGRRKIKYIHMNLSYRDITY